MPVARALFRAIIPEFVRLGYSSSKMIAEARKLSIPTYRRTDMLGDIREFQGFFRYESLLKSWDINELPHRGLMYEVELRRDRRYRVFADVMRQNRINGEWDTRTVSFYDDELRTFSEWDDLYRKAAEEYNYEPEFEIMNVEVRGIEHNTGWRY